MALVTGDPVDVLTKVSDQGYKIAQRLKVGGLRDMGHFKLADFRMRKGLRWLMGLGLSVAMTVTIGLLFAHPLAAWESHYAVTGRAPFNQPEFYPLGQTPPRDRYRPTANWMGRLILPSVQAQGETDWVWMEVHLAPDAAQDLIGKRVRLEWSQSPDVQQDVAAVTQDVKFTPEVEASRRKTGNLYPVRLNGRSRVGPLQAIAGARPKDDVIVRLPDATVVQSTEGKPTLQIATEPLLDSGRYVALVQILNPIAKPQWIPKACPGSKPCSSELFQVQHYNPATGQFDGVQDTVRIPQQPADGFGVFASTSRELERSPAGKAGWYLYGAPDKSGLFTVQAIQPRSLMQLNPEQVILDPGKGLNYIDYNNWQDTEQRKGTIQTTWIAPKQLPAQTAIAPVPEAAKELFQIGTRALVMHLFGGRGGKHGEGSALGTVTGHFAYGVAEVVTDPFTGEPQFEVNYQQVYATNIEGVIAGTNTWVNYMGDQQRGWLGTRPVSDVIVKLDEIGQDYDFGGIKLSPLDEFLRQLHIIMARYRIGDGTGAANVTAATSCVQDSNQALFLTIQRIRETVASSPAIQQWWSAHPNDPTIQRFERLIALGNDLERQLTPLGIVRGDWKSNAEALSGTGIQAPEFVRAPDGAENILTALTSWRTILPRQAQDELSILFLRHGASLWFLRTNQVGGNDPDIVPIAPTEAFARWTLPGTNIPVGSIVFTRILGAIDLPSAGDWWVTGWVALFYSAIALPVGFLQNFLQFKPLRLPAHRYLLLALRLFFVPALVEEFVFRVLLLPYPRAGITGQMWVLWAIVSLIIFIAYHPLNAKTFYPPGNPTFLTVPFLTLTGLLGIACTIAYFLTGSLLTITLIHWMAVFIWLALLGGMERLHPQARQETSI
ncbi:MAG: CPBP family glutamic-type intramembrane protease [Leptolyngbyaceae cyanobacterium bins.302]|nr:CPBP family glutamic-type intramembrane protease [Leptolyngbyaceae cyanobacterium bins.302]